MARSNKTSISYQLCIDSGNKRSTKNTRHRTICKSFNERAIYGSNEPRSLSA